MHSGYDTQAGEVLTVRYDLDEYSTCDEPAGTAVDGHRRAGVARAWRLGTQLAHLVTDHRLDQPTSIRTVIWHGEPIDGYVNLDVRLASIADLLRLAYATDQDIRACPGVGQQMQGYIHVGPRQARICASWATREVTR